ncbi:MAG TPA: HAD hydrolase-like protein [Brevefilum fermentans]|nr:HAD hydrolase-like protein [Brevefilum fermentans]
MNKIENNPIKALFFKIEGTLAYQQKDIESAQDLILRMIDVLGVDCQPADFAEKLIKGESEYQTWSEKYFVDLAPEEKWSRFLLRDLSKELIREHAHTLEKLWRESQAGWQLAEGVVNTLQELSDRGYTLATISRNSLKHLQGETFLDLFCARVQPNNTKRYQPHSGLLLEAAAQCNLSPDECAYIGDRPSRDVIGAR